MHRRALVREGEEKKRHAGEAISGIAV